MTVDPVAFQCFIIIALFVIICILLGILEALTAIKRHTGASAAEAYQASWRDR